jgi:hypothetical protein
MDVRRHVGGCQDIGVQQPKCQNGGLFPSDDHIAQNPRPTEVEQLARHFGYSFRSLGRSVWCTWGTPNGRGLHLPEQFLRAMACQVIADITLCRKVWQFH